jgi:hypothetical protein
MWLDIIICYSKVYFGFHAVISCPPTMCEREMVVAFMAMLETHPMHNDFSVYWSGLWKPLTQRCLNAAKHQFVMQKAFELFQVHVARHRHLSNPNNWSTVFVCEEERNILTSLCRHVKLQEEEFLDYGLNHHRNRCRKYFTTKCRTTPPK